MNPLLCRNVSGDGECEEFCLRCGADLERVVFSIRPRICCASCCDHYFTRCGIYRGITCSGAKKRYGATKGDLNFLSFTTVVDAANGRTEVRLFLEAEVAHLAYLRDLYPMKRAKEMIALDDARHLKERKAELLERLPSLEGSLEPQLLEWVLGDYLTNHRKSQVTWDDILHRYDEVQRAKTVAKECQVDFDVAREFCLEFPGETREFEDLRARRRRVFELEGNRILKFLSREERSLLLCTSLEFAVREFRTFDGQSDKPTTPTNDTESDSGHPEADHTRPMPLRYSSSSFSEWYDDEIWSLDSF